MSVKTFAAISVGSFELSMKIFEFSGKNTIREIDFLSQNVDLGSETYATGKLSKEKIDELCRTLLDFKQVMKSYQVDAFRAYGTSALRETENTLIVLDQIAQRTGIAVKILSNSEQRFLDYKSIASKGESFRKIIEEKTASSYKAVRVATALNYARTKVETGATVTALFRAYEIKEAELCVPVTEADKASLTSRFMFV